MASPELTVHKLGSELKPLADFKPLEVFQVHIDHDKLAPADAYAVTLFEAWLIACMEAGDSSTKATLQRAFPAWGIDQEIRNMPDDSSIVAVVTNMDYPHSGSAGNTENAMVPVIRVGILGEEIKDNRPLKRRRCEPLSQSWTVGQLLDGGGVTDLLFCRREDMRDLLTRGKLVLTRPDLDPEVMTEPFVGFPIATVIPEFTAAVQKSLPPSA
jgi:hypothetical protein